MINVTQTSLHDTAAGTTGNCISAVIAGLLHLDIADVPIFYGINEKGERSYKKQLEEINDWLLKYGLAFISTREHQFTKGCHHTVYGSTIRENTDHAVFAVDGKESFDPHPSRDGLNYIKGAGYFVCLEPWKIAELYGKR